MNIKKSSALLIGVIVLWGCTTSTEHVLRKKTEAYFSAWNKHDFTHPDFADFKMDTSYVWHGKKEGDGIQTIFNPNSGWKQWDMAWNGTYQFKITGIDVDNLKVEGDFLETTDFLNIIGMPEGFSAVVTFWFNKDLKVKETRYNWSDKNRSMHEVIKPIVGWAKENDSLRIQKIYLKDGFVPNKENADEWKALFKLYEKNNTPPNKK